MIKNKNTLALFLFIPAGLLIISNLVKNMRDVFIWSIDFWDMFSVLKLELAKTNEKALLGELLEENFLPQIDSLQGIMDKAHFCSELHAVVKKGDK